MFANGRYLLRVCGGSNSQTITESIQSYIYMYTKQHEACNSIITKPGWLEAIPFRKKTDTQDMLEVMKTISLAFHVHIPENVTNGLGFGFGRKKKRRWFMP